MHQDSKVVLRKQLLDFIDSRTTDYAGAPMWVEARRYVDVGYLRREHDLVFARHPRIAGHASELADPDDALTVTAAGITVTVTRDADGKPVAADADGVSYPACEYAGLIWLLPVAGARQADTGQAGTELDMAAWLGPELDRDVQACGVADAKLYRRANFTLEMNWKAVTDGFTDAYHLQFVHPHTVGPFFHTNIYKCDPFGKNWRMVVARKGLENFRDEDWAVARTVTDSLPFGGVDRLLLGRNEKATQILHGQLARDVPLT